MHTNGIIKQIIKTKLISQHKTNFKHTCSSAFSLASRRSCRALSLSFELSNWTGVYGILKLSYLLGNNKNDSQNNECRFQLSALASFSCESAKSTIKINHVNARLKAPSSGVLAKRLASVRARIFHLLCSYENLAVGNNFALQLGTTQTSLPRAPPSPHSTALENSLLRASYYFRCRMYEIPWTVKDLSKLLETKARFWNLYTFWIKRS